MQNNIVTIEGKKLDRNNLANQQNKWIDKLQNYQLQMQTFNENIEELTVLYAHTLAKLQTSLQKQDDEDKKVG
tara:strand:- start:255 stop:473 length:219 start_codon:yes stop_codon:yes gene_type:complete